MSYKFLILRILATLVLGGFFFLFFNSYLFDVQILIFLVWVVVLLMPNQSPLDFIREWAPLVVLVYVYTMLRGYADDYSPWLYNEGIINLEKGLFGNVWSKSLQDTFFTGSASWFDLLLYYSYLSFFIYPLLVAYWLWAKDKEWFKKYRLAMFYLLPIAVILFFIFPTVPPWLAAEQGLIQGQRLILLFNDQQNLNFVHIAYKNISNNLVAAMPSMHVAWPMLASLFLVGKYGRKGLVSLLLPLLISFAVVYFAEHYIVDVVAGALLSILIFFFLKGQKNGQIWPKIQSIFQSK